MNIQKLNSSCRRAINRSIPTISKSTNRFKWTYKSDEPLILPRVAIDLDALENPAVRDYDDIKDNTPSRHQQQIIRSTEKAIARRTRLVNKQLNEGVEGFPRKRSRKNQRKRDDALEHELAYNPHAAPPPVTAMDLMTYALLGNPFSARASQEPVTTRDIHMEKLFNAHNIDYKDTANLTIRALTEDFDIKTDGKVTETALNTQGNLEAVQRRHARKKELRNQEQRLEEQKKAQDEDQNRN
ncbi:hypothetical protein MFRU_018g00980 [Monilinia fructicola]|uniref:Uncharacterized protein n=1 Tax=Monilinia fructicola TaxID=38448 RepID=A0A5M9JRE3_MONFR|nr:hypothetical protein EYC84_002003 [Monilinia fructicola]KAG4028990.1 hypothetical protein MFRU_018g00980 [Monilinia fructicola]